MKLNWFGIQLSFFRYLLLSGAATGFICELISCSGVPTTGSGTGVGNGMIVGQVNYSSGKPVVCSPVRLRLQDFLPDTSGKLQQQRTGTIADVETDSNGSFAIYSIDLHSAYSIEVIDDQPKSQATLFKCAFGPNDTLVLSPRTVEPAVSVSGEIIIAGLPRNAYILIYGLELVGKSDPLGRFTITNLPVGKCEYNECEYNMRVIVPNADGTTTSIEYEFEIKRDINGNVILPIELEISH